MKTKKKQSGNGDSGVFVETHLPSGSLVAMPSRLFTPGTSLPFRPISSGVIGTVSEVKRRGIRGLFPTNFCAVVMMV